MLSVIGAIAGSLASYIPIAIIGLRTVDLIDIVRDNKNTILLVVGVAVGLIGLVAGLFSLYVRFRHRSARQEALIRGIEASYLEILDKSSINPTSSG